MYPPARVQPWRAPPQPPPLPANQAHRLSQKQEQISSNPTRAQKKPREAWIFSILKCLDFTRTATSGNQAAHEAAARGKGQKERGGSRRGAINTTEYNQQIKFAPTCQHLPSASLSVTKADQAQLPLFQTSSHNLPMTLSVPLEAISLSTCARESPGLLLKLSMPGFRLQTF